MALIFSSLREHNGMQTLLPVLKQPPSSRILISPFSYLRHRMKQFRHMVLLTITSNIQNITQLSTACTSIGIFWSFDSYLICFKMV